MHWPFFADPTHLYRFFTDCKLQACRGYPDLSKSTAKEYILNHIRVPIIIKGIFLNLFLSSLLLLAKLTGLWKVYVTARAGNL